MHLLIMSEISERVDADVEECSDNERPDKRQLWRPKFVPRSKPCNKIAAVCALPRNTEMSGDRPQSPTPSSSLPTPRRDDPLSRTNPETISSVQASTLTRSSQRMRSSPTRPCPFSFDARDSFQRSVREKRLEELRQNVESQLISRSRFRANPVRKYKPLVVTQSSRPLTIPQTPFSNRDA